MRVLVTLLALFALGGAGVARADGIEPTEGAYEGTTAQGFPVHFDVRGRTVSNPTYRVKWGYCGVYTVHLPKESRELDATDHFLFDQGQSAIEGVFTGPSEVEGLAIFREHPLAGCPEKAIPFTAHLRSSEPATYAPRCRTGQLRAALRELSPGAGQRYASLRLVNRGGGTCTLFGYPRLKLLGPKGRKLPTHVVHEPSRQPHLVTLEPGERATARLHWGAIPGRGEPVNGRCEPLPQAVLITPPGTTRLLRLPWRFEQVCEHGKIEATPFA